MTLRDALDSDVAAMAVAYDERGRIVAEVTGPAHCLSKRKRRKADKSTYVMIWTPPKPNTVLGYLCGSKVRRQKLHEVSKDKRRWLDSLDWRPRRARSVIDRLAQLARRM